MTGNKQIGDLGEALARKFLIQRGYQILKCNYRTKFGEIDIVGKKEKSLVFVEVKTRQSYSFGSPREAVHYRKQQNLYRLGEQYIATHKMEDMDIRFDMIEIVIQGDKALITHIENAF